MMQEINMRSGDKRTINMLMNIDNYFGRHEGKLGPTIAFLLISAAPFLLYIFLLQAFIPLKVIVVFEVIWTVIVGLEILGDTKTKLEQYKNKQASVYAAADQLIRISNIQDDGLIEYSNGQIAYIISGYLQDYVDDDSFTIDLQSFLRQLRGLEYDILSQMVIDEYKLQNDFEGLSVYKDTSAVQERMLFYQNQDNYCTANSEAFRVSVVIKGSRYDWKQLKARLDELVNSEFAYCWKEVYVCNRDAVNDIISRDLCMNININKLLINKYKNDEFYGSKVLFYGDEVPEEFKVKHDTVNLNKRRVTM